MSLSDNSLSNVSFEELLKQMPKEFRERFSEINRHLIENDDMLKIQDQLQKQVSQKRSTKDSTKKMKDKIVKLNTSLSKVCDLHKEIAMICQRKMNNK